MLCCVTSFSRSPGHKGQSRHAAAVVLADITVMENRTVCALTEAGCCTQLLLYCVTPQEPCGVLA
jgi:hypothetical protein